jgi:ABC-type amino acid transport substrate-binding protein
MKLEFNYRLTDQWRIFSDLVEGKADIAFSCMPITREWEETVGPLFDIQYYGFMFPEGSELRETVNRALLKLKEDGTYDGIYDKWFGKVGR